MKTIDEIADGANVKSGPGATQLEALQALEHAMENDITDFDRLYNRINDALVGAYREGRAVRLERLGKVLKAIDTLKENPLPAMVLDDVLQAADAQQCFQNTLDMPELEPFVAGVRTFGLAHARAGTPKRQPPPGAQPASAPAPTASEDKAAWPGLRDDRSGGD